MIDNLGIAIKNAPLVACLDMITPPSFVFRCGSIFWSLLWNRLEVSTSLLTFLSSVWEYLNKLRLCQLQSLYSQLSALNVAGIIFWFWPVLKRCTCEVMSHMSIWTGWPLPMGGWGSVSHWRKQWREQLCKEKECSKRRTKETCIAGW